MAIANPARTRSLLSKHRTGGESVLRQAKMVGDETDHVIWSISRRNWRETTIAVIAQALPDEAVMEFRRACATGVQTDDWRQRYQAEVSTVSAGIEQLVALERELGAANTAGL